MSTSVCATCGAPRVDGAVFCFQCGGAHHEAPPLAATVPDNPSFRPIPASPPRPAFATAGASQLDMSHPDLQRAMAQVRFDREWDWGALLLLLVAIFVAAAVYISPAAALFALAPGLFAFVFYLKRRRLYIPYKGSQMAALAAMVALAAGALGGMHVYPFKQQQAHGAKPPAPVVTTPTTPSSTTPSSTTPSTGVTTAPSATTPSVGVTTAPNAGVTTTPSATSPTGP